MTYTLYYLHKFMDSDIYKVVIFLMWNSLMGIYIFEFN